MPDLSTRTDHEEALTALMLSLFAQCQSEAIDWLGFPPKAENLPTDFYARMEHDVEAAFVEVLYVIYLESATNVADAAGLVRDTEKRAAEARAWAKKRSEELARQLRDRIDLAISDEIRTAWEAREDAAAAAGLVLGIGVIFSDSRAESIGVTETTAAISAGEINEVDRLSIEFDVNATAVWVTEADERVCEVCAPLDGTSEEQWGGEFPSGPPAHPNCRCTLDWNISDIDAEPSEN